MVSATNSYAAGPAVEEVTRTVYFRTVKDPSVYEALETLQLHKRICK